MNIKVYYHSSTGNTGKLADEVAQTLNIVAEPISKNSAVISKTIDLLFLGDGVYFGKPHKDTISFISSLNPQKVRNVAVFGTYGGQRNIGTDIQKMLTDRRINVLENPFLAKGQSWVFINRKHPDQTDLENIRSYARWAVSRITT